VTRWVLAPLIGVGPNKHMKSILTSLAVGSLLATIALGQGRSASAPASEWDNVKMLAPGTQIRVADDASKQGAPQQVQGTVESVTDSELVIQQGAGTQSFPRAQIVSVSVKTNGHRLRNALVGLGVGTAAGAVIGFGIGHANCSKTGAWCGLDQIWGAGVGGVGGLAGGTLTGVFWPTEGWSKIYTR
jgi:hypothetical protein